MGVSSAQLFFNPYYKNIRKFRPNQKKDISVRVIWQKVQFGTLLIAEGSI